MSIINLYSDEVGNSKLPNKLQRVRRYRARVRAAQITLVLFVLAAIGVGALFLRHRPNRSAPGPVKKSIAVLPFENLSEDKSNAYFAAGIRDEILTRLANLRELKVIARTSTEKYASHPPDIRTIGAELGVAHLLEGSVQKIGNEVHVNVQLIEASTGSHIWAQSYNRTLEHVFAVEGEVAQTVANELEVALLPAQIEKLNSVLTQNAVAYDAYLKGDYALEQARKNPGDYQSAFEPAIKSLQEATTADPQFALAFARLAMPN